MAFVGDYQIGALHLFREPRQFCDYLNAWVKGGLRKASATKPVPPAAPAGAQHYGSCVSEVGEGVVHLQKLFGASG